MANLTATTITGNLDVTGGGVISGDGSGLSGVDPFASGTKMVFYQASAPTGWTQDTAAALANTALSVVTGTGGGTGGTDSFYSTFATGRTTESKSLPVSGSLSGTVGGTTLSTPTIASHSHPINLININPNQNSNPRPPGISPTNQGSSGTSTSTEPTAAAGGGASHSHPFSGSLSSASTASSSFAIPAMNVKYANVIIAAKD